MLDTADKRQIKTSRTVVTRHDQTSWRWWLPVLLGVLNLLALNSLVFAAEQSQDALDAMVKQARQIELNLKRHAYGISGLSDAIKTVTELKAGTAGCIADSEEALAKVNTALEQLGEKKKGESTEVARQRRQLESERSAIEARMANCNALALRLDTLQENLEQAHKQRLEERMLAQGPNIFTVIGRNLEQPVKWFGETWAYIQQRGWLHTKATARDIQWIIGSLLLGLALGVWLRWRATPWVAKHQWSDSTGGHFAAATLASGCHDAPYVLASVATAICLAVLTYDIHPLPVVSALAYGLSFLFFANLLIRISLEPTPPGKLFLKIPPQVARSMARRFRVLVIIVLVTFVLVDTILGASLPEFAQSLARTIVRILLAINIVWVLWLFRHLSGIKRQLWFRLSLSLVLIVAVIADLMGYSNLSGWLFRSVFGTLVALGIVLTVARLLREFLVGLEYGRTPLEQRIRLLLGLPTTDHLAGFFWLRMLIALGLWGLLVWLLIFIWDLSTSAVQEINLYISEGFTIGSLKIIPARVLLAVITLAGLIAMTSWLKGRMKTHLDRSPMERGAREALITMAGYIGVLVAILVALGVAGIEFANLALIAGALSVGIGFGLQNVVNNFVSGLILLFERPIKTGDWIVVGGTEGYVKRIRIRSTQIQTFDRADVIVPNSELISGQVTNWMLRDPSGRARIPIGVAYGSDTAKVKAILLQVAHEHPEVISDGSAPEPLVLFLQFGESSLDFELRVYIRNIDKRLRVISDLNFAIDAAFREAGVEIPFPQRDVHVRDLPNRPKTGDSDQHKDD